MSGASTYSTSFPHALRNRQKLPSGEVSSPGREMGGGRRRRARRRNGLVSAGWDQRLKATLTDRDGRKRKRLRRSVWAIPGSGFSLERPPPSTAVGEFDPATGAQGQSTNSTSTGFVTRPSSTPPLEEEAYSPSPTLAVIERPIVQIHADEGVCLVRIEAARILHRVIQCSESMM